MQKFLRNLATVFIMGIPLWVIIGAFLQADTTTLVVRVEEPGVRVEIDGRGYDNATTELGPLELEPGIHLVNVSRGTEVLYSKSVRLAAGENTLVDARWTESLDSPADRLDSASRKGSSAEPPLVLRGTMELSGHLDAVTGVGFSADNHAVTVGQDRTLRFWDLNGGPARTVFESLTVEMKGLIIFDGGRKLATLGEIGTLEIMDATTGKSLKRIRTGDVGTGVSLAASSDGKRIVVGSEAGVVRVVDLESDTVSKILHLAPVAVGSLAFSPDGGTLLVGLLGSPQYKHDILVYDLKADKVVRRLGGSRAPVWGVCFLPDGRRAVSVGGDRGLRLWDVEAGVELKNYPGQSGVGRCIAVSPDGRYVVAGTGYLWSFQGGWKEAISYGVTVWDLDEDRVIGRYATSAPVRCLALSPDGRRALAGGEDNLVHAIELPDGKTRNTAISTNEHGPVIRESQKALRPRPTTPIEGSGV